MNIIDVQDSLKNFSEDQLIKEMQMPSGNAPQFLVLSEIQRRKRVRDDFSKRQAAQEPTVAEEAVAAAGVPMQGIAGMSEAMAPQSAVSEGIGTIMPQSMRQTAPAPAPEDMAIGMAEGGVVKAQQGAYFPSNAELYGLYGQESSFGKNMYGSSGEIGPLQIMPTTAIQPGYGIKSLFPELQKAVQSGDYESALAAYQANKAMVDEALMSGQKVEPFVMDYLDKAEAILGNRDLALLSYNQGIAGTKGFEGNPLDTDYVSGVMGNQSGFADLLAERGVKESDLFQSDAEPNFMSAMAATPVNQTQMPDIPQDIIRDQTGRAIGDASYGPRIRAAMETGNEDIANNLVAQGLNEANFFEQMYRNRDPDDLGNLGQDAVTSGVAGITTPVGPGTIDPGQMLQVLPLDTTQKTISGGSTQSDTDKADAAPTSEPQTPPVQPPAPAAPKVESEDTSIEAEILKMQDDLKKGREQDKWLAIAQAGLALMSSKEPTLLGAAGEAGVSGLKAYREAQDRYQEGVIDLVNARAKLDKSKKPKIAQKDILDAQVEIMKDPMATPTERARAKSIVDSIVGGAGFGLVDLRSQAAS